MVAGFWPRLQNAHATTIDMTTVLPLPVAILQAIRRSGASDGILRQDPSSAERTPGSGLLNDGRSPRKQPVQVLFTRASDFRECRPSPETGSLANR